MIRCSLLLTELHHRGIMKNNRHLLISILVLCLSLATGIVLLSGCSSAPAEPETDIEQDVSEESQDDVKTFTIENALVSLIPEGYKETDEGYVFTSFADDVSSKRVITADGNNLTVSLSYSYGNDRNAEMKKFFKEQDEAVNIMVSGFLTRLATEANTEKGSMDYSIYVGGDLAVKGTMSLEDARYYQTLAVD